MNKNPEDLENLIRRLVAAGGNALVSSLENLADLLEDYDRAPRSQSPLLSAEDYEALLQRQGGVCAICGRKPKERLVIDHSHSSGLVRGLLCNRCNLGLGLFGDDQKRLLAAIQYLKAGLGTVLGTNPDLMKHIYMRFVLSLSVAEGY